VDEALELLINCENIECENYKYFLRPQYLTENEKKNLKSTLENQNENMINA
jgi:hypothetical protein